MHMPYPVVCWGSYSPDAVHCLVWPHFVLLLHLTRADQAVSSRQLKLAICRTDRDVRVISKRQRKWKHTREKRDISGGGRCVAEG